MKKRRYNTEFKKEAARLMIMEGLTAGEVSEKLGVNASLLYRWKSEHLEELEGARRSEQTASPKEMAAEIAGLRKDLAKSQRINMILKKRWGILPRKSDEVSLHKRRARESKRG